MFIIAPIQTLCLWSMVYKLENLHSRRLIKSVSATLAIICIPVGPRHNYLRDLLVLQGDFEIVPININFPQRNALFITGSCIYNLCIEINSNLCTLLHSILANSCIGWTGRPSQIQSLQSGDNGFQEPITSIPAKRYVNPMPRQVCKSIGQTEMFNNIRFWNLCTW